MEINKNFLNGTLNQNNCNYVQVCKEQLHCREWKLYTLQDNIILLLLTMGIGLFILLSYELYKSETANYRMLLVYSMSFFNLFGLSMIHAAIYEKFYILVVPLIGMMMFIITAVTYFMSIKK